MWSDNLGSVGSFDNCSCSEPKATLEISLPDGRAPQTSYGDIGAAMSVADVNLKDSAHPVIRVLVKSPCEERNVDFVLHNGREFVPSDQSLANTKKEPNRCVVPTSAN